MAAISHGSVTIAGATTQSASFVDVLTLDDSEFMVNNAVYWIKAVGTINTDEIGAPTGEWEIVSDPTGTPTRLARSFNKLETASATITDWGHPYDFDTVYTQPATAVALEFRMLTTNTACTTSVDELTIYFIRLDEDLTEDTDWRVSVDTSGPTNHTNGMVSRVAETWTPATASHDWLIWGNAEIIINDNGEQYEIELFDSTGSAVLTSHSREGEDTDETQQRSLWTVLENLPATEQVVQVRTRDDVVGTANQYNEAEIFVLDLDVFEEHFYQHTATRLQQVDANEVEINNLEFTPARAVDFLLLAGVVADAEAAGRRHHHWMQLGDVDTPANSGADPRKVQSFDADDAEHTSAASMPALAASAQNLDVMARWTSTGGSSGWSERRVLALSMELAAAPAAAVYPPFPRRQNTLVRM